MSRDRIAGLCIAAAGIITFAAGAFADSNTIVQSGRTFRPAEISIARGTTLDFVNQDEFIHQIYVDSGGFKYDSEEQDPGGAPIHITFPDAGTFPIRCHIHPKMLLTVHVK